MSAIPSDEVAEDYRNSLDDLITNDRYAISNLTLIARENIEHAEAISRVLQNHIQRVSYVCTFPFLCASSAISKTFVDNFHNEMSI
jgi:pre-mRNA cleavage complex 2 protein Pcf11